MNFTKLLNKYREKSFSERDKGDRFERMMQAYLLTDPKYSNIFKSVLLWSEFPFRDDLGSGDTGIDLVAITQENEYWAIQCKCYKETSTIDKAAVDSFITTSGRSFSDDKNKSVRFAHRLWISTTNKWGANATEALKNQNPAVTRINLFDLQEAPVDWEKLDKGITGQASRLSQKTLRPHQKEALDKTYKEFATNDRGKLIMACGTGKTYTSLKIAEKQADSNGLVLFLVPSISLLGQTLREWSADANLPINAICICSDPQISKKKSQSDDGDYSSVIDLALPASTSVKDILQQFEQIKSKKTKGLTVVFSTYQSIDVISNAQKELLKKNDGYGVFDLVICDEAHRTTGVTLAKEDSSSFVKVHDNDFIQAKKRLYMTATPRLYSDETKGKAAKEDAVLCSMDDVSLYGEEIYRIGFGEAVERDLLTDYKVLILTLNDKDVPPAVQEMISDERSEINTDDASKLIGCVNALSKQILGDNGLVEKNDPSPMKRAVAFCQKIAVSEKITNTFNTATDAYISSLPPEKKAKMVSIASEHIDGTMSAPKRDELLGWLKEDIDDGECRILTNVRCLSEGVDVPSLDAVMFLSARNSQVDVVQSVGRVMRKAPGKKYGYIIIPVVVPSDVEASKALDDNERYKVVWTVLNALRAHDDRFNATINKIELNKKKPNNILVGRPEYSFENGEPISTDASNADERNREFSTQLALQFEQLQSIVFARMVKKVGDRQYWEQWAKNVADIAKRQEERIEKLITQDGKHKKAFEDFLKGLAKNINPSITQKEAIEMLSQHVITKPVFEALFEGYSFVKNNAISTSMQKMLDLLEAQALEKDAAALDKFYESVKMRAADIDNAEGKQRIIIELYDKFFKTAFPKMVEKLGIVYTPVEVVDFIIHSVHDVLKKEFGRGIGDENVHILDPFTGTGTFITRLLQSGLIDKKDLERKYKHELFANELVLLAYYIAAVNIENAYHDAMEAKDYEPFEGICLTDTFQLGETIEGEKLFSEMFPKNSERVQRQMKAPLRVIMGNPPYSIGQRSANDNAQNQKYKKLDAKVASTYAQSSSAGLSKSLYDPYIKAFRWSADRLGENDGVICFVSNGKWLDGNSLDGFRKTIEKEFSAIYVFDLRGNQRTSGEQSRREGGKIFGSGSRSKIAITLLVRRPKVDEVKSKILYLDIGDYLSRREKLDKIKKMQSVLNENNEWIEISPNKDGDWLVERNELFQTYLALEPPRKFNPKSNTIFITNAIGVSTNRDAWVYGFSATSVAENMKKMIDVYNAQREHYKLAKLKNEKLKIEDFIDKSPNNISWTRALRRDAANNVEHCYNKNELTVGIYRPYTKQNLYFDKPFIESPGLSSILFPNNKLTNNVILVSGKGSSKNFSTLMTNLIPCLDTVEKSQCFPLYYFEERKKEAKELFDEGTGSEYIRRDGVSDFILERAKKQYGKEVTKEDIFYYVYGFLHSPDYREAFVDDLKKMLPRLLLVDAVKDFWAFSKAGRSLADLHINYEDVSPYEGVNVIGEEHNNFLVEKMRFPKKGTKGTILYNGRITIENIPDEAYEYIVNGKSAIEWIIERYQVKIDKKSGIKNDPNDWAEEVGNPRYILDLLLSIINVSVQTVEIVKGLPKVKFD